MPRRPEAMPEPLFSAKEDADAPLAARMRPRTLDEIVGQDSLVGPKGALRKLVDAGHLPSLLLWGPPGTGKTTLARVLAASIGGQWRQLSAVTAGVADVRKVIAEARALRTQGERTVLFLDEAHRFNKAQQDALLPVVEDGTIILVASSTENPYTGEHQPSEECSDAPMANPVDAARDGVGA